MDFASMEGLTPFIVVFCYCVAEVAKATFMKTDERKKMIPVFCTIVGSFVGAMLYFFAPSGLEEGTTLIGALSSGAFSGLASTGCNQLYNKIKEALSNKSTTSESSGNS